MKERQNHLGLYVIMGLTLLFGALCPEMITFAGEINGNEAGVIAAASGTFSYDGKTYKADTAYINSLTAYLSADDVDLTAEQASRAISMMYERIGEGVANGYLYEVGGSPDVQGTTENPIEQGSSEESSTEEEDTEEKGQDKTQDPDGKKDSKQEQTTEKGQNGSNSGDVDLDVWEAMSNQTEAKKKLQERPDKEEASASVQLDKEDITITTDSGEINISKVNQLISDETILVIDGISGIILAITVICGIILFVTKCMVLKKPKRRRARPGHSRRRKIRRYTRNVLTVTTAVSMVGIFALIGIHISLFNQNTIMQNMQSSGYFNYAYSEYVSDVARSVVNGAGIAEVGELDTYEEYLFTIKQNSIKILNGETDIPIPDSNVAPYIYNMKRSYMQLFHVAGVFLILSMVLGVVLMIFMDQRRDRGVKHTAVAELVASGILILFTVVMLVNRPYRDIYIEPDYLYLFIMECVSWSVKVMTSIVAFGVVLGMILIGVYKTMVNNASE